MTQKNLNRFPKTIKYYIILSLCKYENKWFFKGNNWNNIKESNRGLINWITLLAILLSTAVKGQVSATIFYISEDETITNFRDIYIANKEPLIRSLESDSLHFVQSILLMSNENHGGIGVRVIKISQRKIAKSKTPIQIASKLKSSKTEARDNLLAMPFGGRQSDNNHVFFEAKIVPCSNSLNKNKSAYFIVTFQGHGFQIATVEKKIVLSTFYIALPPKEQFNRYFSLPPPEVNH